jgi:hypothetical protein
MEYSAAGTRTLKKGGGMLGSALYYPHIDIHDAKWLRSAILFWDEIKTIAPRAIRDPYQGKDTRILWQEGFLEPLRCDLHPELLDTLGKRVVGLMDGNFFERDLGFKRASHDPNAGTLMHADKVGMEIRHQFRRAHIHPGKLSLELRDLAMRAGLARMHPEKLSPKVRDLIEEIGSVGMHPEKWLHLRHLMRRTERQRDNDGEWLLVDSHFAEVYMSALAALLAKETDLAALTSEEPSMGVNLHTLLEDVKPSAQSDKKGALVSFVMEAISVDPATRVDKLLAFRRSRDSQLSELSAQFDDISSKISNCETAKELEEKVRDTYVTRIRPKLESLKEELGDNSIQAVWDGVQRAVTISVPAGGAMAYFSGLTGTTLLAAAGAAIAVTDVAVKTHLARKKTRRASPYTYLLDVERKFSMQKF